MRISRLLEITHHCSSILCRGHAGKEVGASGQAILHSSVDFALSMFARPDIFNSILLQAFLVNCRWKDASSLNWLIKSRDVEHGLARNKFVTDTLASLVEQ